jgi:glycosyltransferase involved in cell wall biosynthesis
MVQIIINKRGDSIPKVSVVMPVYNGDKYLSEAVDSILNQTFSDLEFIIICDEPTEKTRLILDKYQQNDNRVKINYQERQGLVNSRNRGISLARGEYIAIMDADDISLPNRLKKQVEFMDNNKDIGISGTWVKLIGKSPKFILKHPCNHEDIISNMLFYCTIAQPSVLIRRNIFCKNGLFYRREETHAEDYGLWVRAASVLKLANIPQVHLYYRIHNSTTNTNIQKGVSSNIRLSQIKKLGINPTTSEIEIHEELSNYTFTVNKDYVCKAKSWLEKLQDANFRMNIYPEPAFSKVLLNYWYVICRDSLNVGLNSWHLFNCSKLSKSVDLPYIKKFWLVLKPNVINLLNEPLR